MLKRSVVVGSIVLLIALGVALVITQLQQHTYNGVVYENPSPAPPLNLIGPNNDIFELGEQKGKIVLVFFGYTSCPDVCPSTLSDLKQVMNLLGEKANNIQPVFVTVDPDRDNVEKLEAYMSLFHPGFVGLTGEEEELAKAWNAYGVFRQIDDSSDTAAGYLVNHSSRIYLIDQLGRLLITYGFGTPPDSIAKDINYLLRQ